MILRAFVLPQFQRSQTGGIVSPNAGPGFVIRKPDTLLRLALTRRSEIHNLFGITIAVYRCAMVKQNLIISPDTRRTTPDAIETVSRSAASLPYPRTSNDLTASIMSEPATNPMPDPIKILLVDDHQIMRQGLRQLISSQSGMTIVGEASDGLSALIQLRSHKPNLVLMDVHLSSESGIEVTQRILAEAPSVKVIVLSSDSELQLILQALNAGVAGYVLKESGCEELVRAIRTVMDHRIYLSPEVSSVVIQDFIKPGSARTSKPAPVALTEREQLLLRLIAEGKRNKEMSVVLEVTVKSVETYRSRLMKKLGCATTADLVRYAVRNGIVQP